MKLLSFLISLFSLIVLFSIFLNAFACYVPDHKILICHVPPGNPENAHVIEVDKNAWEQGHNPHNSHYMDFVVSSRSDDCPKKEENVIPSPTPTSTPTPTPTPSCTPVATPTPTCTPAPTPTSTSNSSTSCNNNCPSQNVLGSTTIPQLPQTGSSTLAFLALSGLLPMALKIRRLAKIKKN